MTFSEMTRPQKSGYVLAMIFSMFGVHLAPGAYESNYNLVLSTYIEGFKPQIDATNYQGMRSELIKLGYSPDDNLESTLEAFENFKSDMQDECEDITESIIGSGKKNFMSITKSMIKMVRAMVHFLIASYAKVTIHVTGEPLDRGTFLELEDAMEQIFKDNHLIAENSPSFILSTNIFTDMTEGEDPYQYISMFCARNNETGHWTTRIILTKVPIDSYKVATLTSFFGAAIGAKLAFYDALGERITDIISYSNYYSVPYSGVNGYGQKVYPHDYEMAYTLGVDNMDRKVTDPTNYQDLSMWALSGEIGSLTTMSFADIVTNNYVGSKEFGCEIDQHAVDADPTGGTSIADKDTDIDEDTDIDDQDDDADVGAEFDDDSFEDTVGGNPDDMMENAQGNYNIVPFKLEYDDEFGFRFAFTAYDDTKKATDAQGELRDRDGSETPTKHLPYHGVSGVGYIDGFTTVYKVSKSQASSVAKYLWVHIGDVIGSQDLFQSLKAFFNNPIDAVISLNAYPLSIDAGNPQRVSIGSVETNVTAPIVTNLIQEYSMGTVTIPRKFNNFLDYDGNTFISLYLPFIGNIDLSPDDVMGSRISLKYRVELATGTCAAIIKIKRGQTEFELAPVMGNCSFQIPVTAAVYSGVVSAAIGAASTLGAGAGAGNKLAALATTASAINDIGQSVSGPSFSHSGSVAGNGGLLCNLQPFILVKRPITNIPKNYAKLNGKPSNFNAAVWQLQEGFAQFESIEMGYIEGITHEEETELKSILTTGFYV